VLITEESMKQGMLSIVLLLALAPAAFAQNPSPSRAPGAVSAVPSVRQDESTHRRFTALVNLGAGVWRDGLYDETLAAVTNNLGIGAFVTDRVAILARYSAMTTGTDSRDFSFSCSPNPCAIRVSAGVAGATAQFWVNRRFAIEGGAGVGFQTDSGGGAETGFGLILGATADLVHWGKHHLTAGFEYAPAFMASETIHTFGFVIGYQFVR